MRPSLLQESRSACTLASSLVCSPGGIMFQQSRVARASIIAALLLVVTGISESAMAAENCDRACLTGLLTTYVDAMVAHDSSKLPLAGDVKVTENSKAIKLGEGLWKTATARGGFRQDYLDLKKQVAAAHLVILEGETQALYTVLLHVTAGRISGIETLVQRITADSRFKPTELGKPVKGMNDPVPAGKEAAARVDDQDRPHLSRRDCASATSPMAELPSRQKPIASKMAWSRQAAIAVARTAACTRRTSWCIPASSPAWQQWMKTTAPCCCG